MLEPRHRRVLSRSVPEVLEPLGVASLGLATTDADDIETLRAGLERANHARSDAQHVPGREFDDRVIELRTTRPGHDDVGLLLDPMPVAPGHPRTRLVGEAAHPELGGAQSVPREPPLYPHVPRADVAKL